jgi:hypothetical protein
MFHYKESGRLNNGIFPFQKELRGLLMVIYCSARSGTTRAAGKAFGIYFRCEEELDQTPMNMR